MAPRPIPPSEIRPPSTSIGIPEGQGESADGEHEYAVQLRNQWRAALIEHLSDPATRSLELVLADPSRQNIVHVVNQLNAADVATRASVSEILAGLIANNYLSESSKLSMAMKEIRSSLRDTENRSESPSTAATATGQ